MSEASPAPIRAQAAGSRSSDRAIDNIVAASFIGPIPPPNILGGYEDVCPGMADRIMRMAEQEAEHRRNAEAAIVSAGIDEARRAFNEGRRGQLCALVITVMALGLGGYVAIQGHEIAGSILGVGGIGSIVTAFLIKPTETQIAPEQPQQRSKRQKKS